MTKPNPLKALIRLIKLLISAFTTGVIVVGVLLVAMFFYGIKPYVVVSGSMEPAIKTGSVCFVNQNAPYSALKVSDIIAFRTSRGAFVTHRIAEITPDGIVTKGDANDITDGPLVTSDNYVGKTVFWIPGLGFLVAALKTTRGKIIGGTLIALIFIYGMFFSGSNANHTTTVSKREET